MTDAEEDQQPKYSPNKYGVGWGDFEAGDRVRMHSSHTGGVVTALVEEKDTKEGLTGDIHADITVELETGQIEFAELPQIREVLGS